MSKFIKREENCIETNHALFKCRNDMGKIRGSSDRCEKKALSMKKRINSVINNNSGPTKY